MTTTDKEKEPTTETIQSEPEPQATNASGELSPVNPSAALPEQDSARSHSVSPPPGSAGAVRFRPLAGSTPPPAQRPLSAPVPDRQTDAYTEPTDPQIAALKAIFPDYDDVILQSVLQSVNGNQDRAIDVLLGMSDPNFKSETPPLPPPQPQPQVPPMTQEELDEQFARRLMLEEQEQHRQWRAQHRPSRRTTRTESYNDYQVSSPPSQPADGKDTMGDFQEQFSKIAESGKKTFGAFVSKVKAKIQEFDRPDQGVQPTWGTSDTAAYYGPNTLQSPPQTNYQPYHGHSQGIPQGPPPQTSTTAIQQQPAFYDPDPSPQPSPLTQYPSPHLPETRAQTQPSSLMVEGYDVTPLSSTSQPVQSSAAMGATASGLSTSNPSSPPRIPSPENPIDRGKLGLLPKRPISLIRDPPQTQPQHQAHDEDDLEYAENPFEDSKK